MLLPAGPCCFHQFNMPHIKLEYSADTPWSTPINKILSELQNVLIEKAGVSAEKCRSRAVPLNNFLCTVNGKTGGFIHLEILILEGRSKKVKSEIGKACILLFRDSLTDASGVQISIELRDLIHGNYFSTSQT